ncbi:MAG: LPS assembly lipoprotein LptE [Ginsengibacter sp.]
MIVIKKIRPYLIFGLLMFTCCFATCKYSTKDVSPIPADIKTFRVNYFQNKARYVNPQVTPKLTEDLKQKIIGQTRLRQVNDDNANYDISGYLSDYSVTTSGVANQQAGTNRLNVTFHLVFKNNVDPKQNFEADFTNNYDFAAGMTLTQEEAALGDKLTKNIIEAIFTRIFSNW